jgi:glycosyltransferase involved in cell wall biosynthesis
MESALTLPGEWPTPSVESAAAQLRKIYEDYAAAQKKAKFASQYVRKNFNLDVFAKNIDSYLRSIL